MVDFTGIGESLNEEAVFGLTRLIAGAQAEAIKITDDVWRSWAGRIIVKWAPEGPQKDE